MTIDVIVLVICLAAIMPLGITLAIVYDRAKKREVALRADIDHHRNDARIYKMSHELVIQRFNHAEDLVTAYQDAIDAFRKSDLPVIVTNKKTLKLIDDSLSVRIAEAHRKAVDRSATPS